MTKFEFSKDNKRCTVNGKTFDVKWHAPFHGITLSIEGTGNKDDRGQQHIDVADFKGVRANDLPPATGISIYFVNNTPFPYIYTWDVKNQKQVYQLTLVCDFCYRDWKEPANLNLFLQSLKDRLERTVPEIREIKINDQSETAWFSVTFRLSESDDLYDATCEFANKIREQFEHIKSLPVNHDSSSSFVARFCFPPHLERACQQYLVYFAEFLRDLGIEADTELLRDGKELLFSVIPKDKNEALYRIKEALAIYLKLPEIYSQQKDSLHITSPEMEVVLQKYIANIEHLQSQLRLAEALIKTGLNRNMNDVSRFVSVRNDIFVTSLNDITIESTKEDTKSFFGGIVKLGSWKKGPVEVNTPKLLEGLKKLAEKIRSGGHSGET